MRQSIAAILTAALLLTVLGSGCSAVREPEITTTTTTTVPSTTPVAEPKEEDPRAEIDPLYKEIIEKYRAAAEDKLSESELLEQDLSPMLTLCYDDDPLESIGWLVTDLDGNSSNELVLGSILGEESALHLLFAVYTIYGGQRKEIFVSQYRDRLYSCTGRMFLETGSGGAANSLWMKFGLDGTGFAFIDGVYTDGFDDGEVRWYRATSDTATADEGISISEVEAMDLVEQMEASTTGLSLVPLSEYKA
ncbi:MAG: hypothetical protein IKX83_05870 [Clostridia bacterium]|nr:hypothetical protein [Clostridia bacterium]